VASYGVYSDMEMQVPHPDLSIFKEAIVNDERYFEIQISPSVDPGEMIDFYIGVEIGGKMISLPN